VKTVGQSETEINNRLQWRPEHSSFHTTGVFAGNQVGCYIDHLLNEKENFMNFKKLLGYSTGSLVLIASIALAAPGKGPPIKVGPIAVVAQGDIGTCNNVWALDSFNKFYTITPNKDGTYNVQVNYKDGTFVTVAGISPGACEVTGGSGPDNGNGNTVAAGISGRTHQEYNGTVIGTLIPGATCGTGCVDTISILDTLFQQGWTWVPLPGGHWTWTGHYKTRRNGTWFDTSVNWPFNDRGDITSNLNDGDEDDGESE
jgi:hypothetical protein